MSEIKTQTAVPQSEKGIPAPPAAEAGSHPDAPEKASQAAPFSVAPSGGSGDEHARGMPLEQAFARINQIERVLREMLDSQPQRFAAVRNEMAAADEMLLGQIAELETKSRQVFQEAEDRNAQKIAALAQRIETVEIACIEAQRRVSAGESHTDRERMRQNAYQQAWQAAPLTLRLKFVRELLPENHALQSALKEMEALETLRRRGQDLENWLTNYPSLFADAAQALDTGENAADPSAPEMHIANALAAQTLEEARTMLEATLQALGIAWIAPVSGEALTAEHEVVGEEAAPHATGCIARLRRRGFRIQGRLALPAQVFRAVAPAATATADAKRAAADDKPAEGEAETTERDRDFPDLGTAAPAGSTAAPAGSTAAPAGSTPATPNSAGVADPEISHDATGQDREDKGETGGGNASGAAQERRDPLNDIPDWLRTLRQRSFECDVPSVCALAEQAAALDHLPAQIADVGDLEEMRALLTRVVHPLLPLLGLRYADGLPDIPREWGAVFLDLRDPLLTWLKDELGLCILSPSRGSGFDPETMEAVETRRTAHADEENTIAKMERIGLLWHDRPLLRAQVVRYASGDGA